MTNTTTPKLTSGQRAALKILRDQGAARGSITRKGPKSDSFDALVEMGLAEKARTTDYDTPVYVLAGADLTTVRYFESQVTR
jgi:hypothetical protein